LFQVLYFVARALYYVENYMLDYSITSNILLYTCISYCWTFKVYLNVVVEINSGALTVFWCVFRWLTRLGGRLARAVRYRNIFYIYDKYIIISVLTYV
jgi:hypothetical protein